MNEQILYGRPQFPAQLNMSHPLSRGLVGCWVMNDPSGLRVLDSSPYQRHGIKNGTFNKSGTYRDNLFDGATSYISFAKNPPLFQGTNDFSIVTWANKTVDVTSTLNCLSFLVNSTDQFQFRHGSGAYDIYGAGTFVFNNKASIWTLNTIYCVIFERRGSLWSVYQDGVEIGTPTSDARSVDTISNDYVIGSQWNGLGQWHSGSIFMSLVYNRALSQSERYRLVISPYDMFLH